MRLIVGLGNPGPEYVATRHNAGFMVVDRLARRHAAGADRAMFHGLVMDGQVAGARCLLLKPMTYMNRSGQSVGEAVGFYKLDPAADVLVVVDDVALPAGRIRLRAGGSAGGHNGLTDIERALGTREYPRLRIGIDSPGRVPQRDYVLGRFSPDQVKLLEPALDAACDAIECWITDGIDKAMTRYNVKEEQAKPPHRPDGRTREAPD